jgi:hypothetical protein
MKTLSAVLRVALCSASFAADDGVIRPTVEGVQAQMKIEVAKRDAEIAKLKEQLKRSMEYEDAAMKVVREAQTKIDDLQKKYDAAISQLAEAGEGGATTQDAKPTKIKEGITLADAERITGAKAVMDSESPAGTVYKLTDSNNGPTNGNLHALLVYELHVKDGKVVWYDAITVWPNLNRGVQGGFSR